MPHSTSIASTAAWEASFRQHLSDLIRMYNEGMTDERIAELLLAAFSDHAWMALAQRGAQPSAAAVRALADHLLAAGVASS